MKKYQDARLLLIGPLALVLMNTACVSTTLQLPSDHPALANAPSGRVEIEPAAILRPNAPLYPSEARAVRAQGEDRDPAPAGTREAPYVGQGVIQRIGEGQLEIQHEAIPGFMGAMTMPFPITEEAMNDSLEVGDEIIFKIAVHPEHGVQIFSVAAVVAESDQAEPAPRGTREAPYVGQGVIRRIGAGQLEIQHEAIPGFMGAMTMPFPITEEAMNDSLEVGDEIIFKIAVHPEHGIQIFSVDVVAAESDQAPANETGHEHNAPGPTGSSTP